MLVANKRCISTTTPSRFDREKSLNSSPESYQAIGRQRDKKPFEIAKSLGYESEPGFSKAFKRVLGITPGEQRCNGTQTPQPLGT
jgi:hypothetical protein